LSESWRCFIAISPDTRLLDAILELMRALTVNLSSGWRWTSAVNLHLTLHFLGDTDPQRIPDLDRALRSAVEPFPPLKLRFNRLGGFPRPAQPSLLWLGLEEDQTLLQLSRAIENSAAAFGYLPETKPFHPHLTLARLTDRTNQVAARQAATLLKASPKVNLPAWDADHFLLMRSQLQRPGALYTVITRVKLGRS